MPTLFLHIGYSKTETTFVQKEVFTSIHDVHYLDRPSIDLIPPKMPGDGIFRRIFAAAPEIWLEHGPEILATLGIDSHEYTLVSDENACEMKQTYQLIAAHLKALMEKYRGNVKVILTIRRQAAKLASHYAQYSHKIQGASQSHFEQWVRNMIHTASGYYR